MPPLFGSSLSLFDALRIRWWHLGLTPTSRLRKHRYVESRRDRRSPSESFLIARSYGTY